MKTKTFLCSVALVAAVPCGVLLADEPSSRDSVLRELTEAAVSANTSTAAAACAALRADGPRGLDALLGAHRETIISMREGRLPLANEQAHRIRTALDSVAKQRDAFASGLYWFTDFDQAKAAAHASGRPIISLRLLGQLDEEFSCANSRFFRTTLYANREISALLREHFILHWKSVRPVPRITVDFGDGRVLERTVTGNSIHYILDADGAVVDALPGLQGPGQFLSSLRGDLDIARRASGLTPQQRADLYTTVHRDALESLEAKWAADLAQLGIEPRSLKTVRAALREGAGMSDETWTRIAALHSENARLDASSRALLRVKNPTAEEAGRRAVSKTVVEAPLFRAMRNLETTIAQDTVRNEYMFHSQIHEWLGAGSMHDAEALNRRVYAELFLTPDNDPWLGMKPNQTLSALEGEGLRSAGR